LQETVQRNPRSGEASSSEGRQSQPAATSTFQGMPAIIRLRLGYSKFRGEFLQKRLGNPIGSSTTTKKSRRAPEPRK
jgi:hypothetical protein